MTPTQEESPNATPQTGGKSVTFVELFFDLVFVFSLTQVTGVVAHHLDWTGLLQAVLVFWLIWWAWTQFTWALNAVDTRQPVVRITVLVGTAMAFLMGAGVDEAFDETGLWFAIPYALVKMTGLSFIVRQAFSGQNRAQLFQFAGISLASISLVVIGAALPLPWRYALWLTAIVVDLVSARVATSSRSWRLDGRSWNMDGGHFAERHALFVILVLGESLVAAALVTNSEARSLPLLLVAIGTVVVTCLLWWNYFGWFQAAAGKLLKATAEPGRTQMASDAYSMFHFPLVAGVIAIAAVFEEMLLEPFETLEEPAVVAIAIGVSLFVGFTALAWARIARRTLWPRFLVLVVLWIGLAVLASA
ncbi:MAG: low temperature requirement protein A, partial [Actinobacteria bacterium]|nr:low temperature requirement protein A [Actinomycetota bacterium]